MKAYTQPFAQLALAATLAFGINPSHAAVVEPFTGGQLSVPGWSVGIGADASYYLSTAAPDGSFGIALSEGNWSYNSSLSFLPGQTLSAWINPGPSQTADNSAQGGRIYLGFDASASGAYSFVAASDTSQLGFQNNAGYATPDFGANAVNQAYNDQWYLLQVALSANGNSATAYLYDTNGQLLNSLTQAGLSSVNAGLALRGIGGAAITSLSVTEVPLPAALPMMASAIGLLGFWSRRRG